MRASKYFVLGLFSSLAFGFEAVAQQSTPLPEGGQYWKPGNSNDRHGDYVSACDDMFYDIPANAGLTPNAYTLAYDADGDVNQVTCAQYDTLGGFSGGTTGHAGPVCPSGTAPSGDSNVCSKPLGPGLQCGAPLTRGNPISVLNGEKIHNETDFTVGRGRLKFVRSYSSLGTAAGGTALGVKWDSNFHPLVHSHYNGSRGHFTYRVPAGPVLRFQKHNGVWRLAGLPWGGAGGWVTRENNDRKDLKGYRIEEFSDFSIEVTTPDNVVRKFTFNPPPTNGSATLIGLDSIRYPDGYEITLNYGTSDQVQSVTDTDGYTINFAYNNRDLLESATAPDGTLYKYEYAETGMAQLLGFTQLYQKTWQDFSVPSRVIYPDDTPGDDADNPFKSYAYADRIFVHPNVGRSSFLAAITDERGIKIKEWDYDYYGQKSGIRATASRGANGVDETTFDEIIERKEYKVTNAKGKETLYKYIDYAKVPRLQYVDGVATSNCAASNTTFAYDAYGNPKTALAEEGQRTERTFDTTHGLVTQIRYGVGTPEQENVSIAWDTSIRKPTSIERTGLRAEFTYDASQNVTERKLIDTTSHTTPYSTSGQTRIWTYAWNPDGLLASIDGPLTGSGDTVSFTYDTLGNLASVTDEVGHVTTINSVDGMGRPTQMTDPNGVIISMTYSPRGWIEQVSVNDSGNTRVTDFTYDNAGNLTQLDFPNGSWLSYTYDDASWLTGVTTSAGNTISYQHDLLGNVTRADFGGGTPSAYYTMQYDDLGRLTQLLGGAGDVRSFAYDRSNRQTSMTDGTSQTWLTGFDALNRVISETDPESHTIGYAWDDADDLVTYTDARSLATTFVRNGFGEIIREVSPDRGTTDFWYDAAGRMTRMLDAEGDDVTYAYDDAGRIISETYPNQTALNMTYAYDSVAGGNKGKGQLTSVSGVSSGHVFTYNGHGDLTSKSSTVGIRTYTLSQTYNGLGQRSKVTLPSGREVDFTYDADSRIASITTTPSGGASQTVVSNVTYAPFGPITGYSFGNGATASFGLDASQRLSSLSVSGSGGSLLSKSYSYDNNSRATWITDNLNSANTASYVYTPDGRLENAVGPWGDFSWTYDQVGNRLTDTRTVGGVLASDDDYTYGSSNNRLLSVSDSGGGVNRMISYTADGNINTDVRTSNPSRDYDYDDDGRLAQVSISGSVIATYDYDAFEHRVRRTAGGVETHFVFSPTGNLIGEYEGATGNVIHEYIWLGDRLVGTVDSIGTLTFVQTGHLGQPLLVMDGAGAALWSGETTPFGVYVATSGSASDPDLRFPGQWLEAGSGLYQNWHRDYDASLGRYVEADPLGISAGQSNYSYVRNNPINLIDAEGLQAAATAESIPMSTSRPKNRFGPRFGPLGLIQSGAEGLKFTYDMYQVPFETIGGAMNDVGGVCIIPIASAKPKDAPIAVSLPQTAPQSCPDDQKNRLQEAKDNACNRPRKCNGDQSKDMLMSRLAASSDCATARKHMMNLCFGGGDAPHGREYRAAIASAANCRRLLAR